MPVFAMRTAIRMLAALQFFPNPLGGLGGIAGNEIPLLAAGTRSAKEMQVHSLPTPKVNTLPAIQLHRQTPQPQRGVFRNDQFPSLRGLRLRLRFRFSHGHAPQPRLARGRGREFLRGVGEMPLGALAPAPHALLKRAAIDHPQFPAALRALHNPSDPETSAAGFFLASFFRKRITSLRMSESSAGL